MILLKFILVKASFYFFLKLYIGKQGHFIFLKIIPCCELFKKCDIKET